MTQQREAEKAKRPGLQGPRPTPLKISRDSHKNPLSLPMAVIQQQQQRRPPVIIYTRSPEVIHTKPQDFMKLVQRLTGPGTNTSHARSRSKKKSKQEEADVGVAAAAGGGGSQVALQPYENISSSAFDSTIVSNSEFDNVKASNLCPNPCQSLPPAGTSCVEELAVPTTTYQNSNVMPFPLNSPSLPPPLSPNLFTISPGMLKDCYHGLYSAFQMDLLFSNSPVQLFDTPSSSSFNDNIFFTSPPAAASHYRPPISKDPPDPFNSSP